MKPAQLSETTGLIDRIISCAASRFGTFGFRKTTVDEISADLRISKRTLYTVFPSKDAILREVAWRDTRVIIAEFNASVPADASAERIILDLCRFIFNDRLSKGKTGRFKSLFGSDNDIHDAYRSSLARIFSALHREGMAHGALKPIDPDLAAEQIVSLVLTATSKFHLFKRPAAVFTDTLSMIADAISFKNRPPVDTLA